MRDYIFLILALVALVVVFLTRDIHKLNDPRKPGIADNDCDQNLGPGETVGDSNAGMNDPVSRNALANVPWRYALGMAPLRTVTRTPRPHGVRNNNRDTFTPMEAAELVLSVAK